MKLCDKIYTCRTRAKLSQEELAEQVGVSRQAVSRWECGDNVPEPGKLLMLARLFGVTADWLLDDSAEMPDEPQAKEEPKQPWVDTLVENCKSLANRFDRMLDESFSPDQTAQTPPEDSEVPTEAPAPDPEPAPEPAEAATEPPKRRTLAETFRQLVGRFGWRLGVYIALAGIIVTALSTLAQQLLTVAGLLMLSGGVTLTIILLAKAKNNRKK